jgi:hypothetical protein
MEGMSHGGSSKPAPSGGMGGNPMGGAGGLTDYMLGSSMTQPLLKLAVGYFPKMGLFKKEETVTTAKRAGAKGTKLWFGPFDIDTVAVSC